MSSYALTDGRVVTIRPIRPDDGERLRATHGRLSADTQYRRFLGAKPQLTPADARYLTHVDGRDHHALVATAGATVGVGEIVAVARYIRPLPTASSAEFAIVVADGWQRAGLGNELLARLADAAAARGIQRFRATTLADNIPLRRMVRRIAAGPIDVRADGSTVELDFALLAAAGGRAAA
jgi:RimJ/RimL family protein N-acetyltransferase